MVGTLLAVVVSLSLIALFVQDRWLFIVFKPFNTKVTFHRHSLLTGERYIPSS